jgi:DNA-binding NtrC family response regulator
MLGTIVTVADSQELQTYLTGRFEDREYAVHGLRDIAEALTYLRDPSASATVVVFTNAMRRQHDFQVLSDILSFRKHMQVLIMADSIGLALDPSLANPNIRVLQKPVSYPDLGEAIQLAIEVADARIAQIEAAEELRAIEQGDSVSTSMFAPAFLTRVGMADVPVLLCGETGVGKEVMARRLCAHSPRAQKPFLKLNCAALPSELIESELFGYEKGAFTGATIDKPGKFEIAQNGTILLDEIGDMDVRLQAKLLTVLQDGEIQPLGSRKTIKLNVRVLAATHRDLRRAIEHGTFREDLYYRLNVINITIPALRERRDEILPLAESLLRRHLRPGTNMPPLTDELKSLMLEYNWPGNVRELENMMRRFLVYQNASMLAGELSRSINESKARAIPSIPPASTKETPILPIPDQISSMNHLAEASRQAETKLLLDALEATRWNRRQAAARVNLEYKAFLYKLQKFGIVEKREKAEAQPGA